KMTPLFLYTVAPPVGVTPAPIFVTQYLIFTFRSSIINLWFITACRCSLSNSIKACFFWMKCFIFLDLAFMYFTIWSCSSFGGTATGILKNLSEYKRKRLSIIPKDFFLNSAFMIAVENKYP